jgi:hypothetical protein
MHHSSNRASTVAGDANARMTSSRAAKARKDARSASESTADNVRQSRGDSWLRMRRSLARLVLAFALAVSVPLHGIAQAFTPKEVATLEYLASVSSLEELTALWEAVQEIRYKLRRRPPADTGINCTGSADACTFAIAGAQAAQYYTVTLHSDYNADTVMVSSDKNCSVSPGLTLGVPTTQLVGSNPARLQVYVDAAAACTVIVGERIVNVANGGDLQAAIDAAVPGDTLLLASGAAWTGSFFLDAGLTGWVKLKCADTTTVLTSNDNPGVIQTDASARYWYLQGCTLRHGAGVRGGDLIRLGTHTQLEAAIPEYFVLDGIHFDGHATNGGKGGIKLHTGYTKIINSTCDDMRWDSDSNCIGGWNGPGPYVIDNNYIESCGYGMMLGGSVPSITNMVPQNITVIRNVFTKDLAWETEDNPNIAGDQRWSCKNLLEFKAGINVSITFNTFSNNWHAATNVNGSFLWLKSVNQNDDPGTPGGCTWCEVRNVTYANNIATNVAAGVSLTDCQGNSSTCVAMSNVTISNNYFELDPDQFTNTAETASGRQIQLGGELDGIVFDHNTFHQLSNANERNISISPDTTTLTGFVFTNNVFYDSDQGVRGDGTTEGTTTIANYSPDYIFENNLRISPGNTGTYPAGNYTELSYAAAGFNTTTKLFNVGSKYLTLSTTGTQIGWDGTGGDQ